MLIEQKINFPEQYITTDVTANEILDVSQGYTAYYSGGGAGVWGSKKKGMAMPSPVSSQF